MTLCGIDFAPLNVPLERRLQTLAVTTWLSLAVLGGPISWVITFITLVFGYQWMKLLTIAYLLFAYYYDKDTMNQGGRSKRMYLKFRNSLFWRYYCDYFPIKLIKTVDLDPKRNYLLCLFPHGIIVAGVTASLVSNAADCAKIFPGLDIRVATLDQHLKTPILREGALNSGVVSCDKKSLNYLLSKKPTIDDGPTEDPVTGRAVVLVPGGISEAFKWRPGTYNIIVKRRKGFVRCALKNGAPLVPVFSFGENDLYNQLEFPEGSLRKTIQEYLKKITGITLTIPLGRGIFQYSFGLLPHRRPIYVVVGAPIEVPEIEEPTEADIGKFHGLFIEKLVELFETHKSKYLRNLDTPLILGD